MIPVAARAWYFSTSFRILPRIVGGWSCCSLSEQLPNEGFSIQLQVGGDFIHYAAKSANLQGSVSGDGDMVLCVLDGGG